MKRATTSIGADVKLEKIALLSGLGGHLVMPKYNTSIETTSR